MIVVSAAASLADAFAEIKEAFEADHGEVRVDLNLGGSGSLREQILGGAPVSVFASADRRTMDEVVDVVDVSMSPRVFATNAMTVAVPRGNPADIAGLADLANDAVVVGLCAAPVPCGVYAREVLDNAGVVASVDTEEPNVTSLVLKIGLGEVDAGIVYLTDASTSSGLVEAIPIPDDVNVRAEYLIAALDGQLDAAGEFVEFVLSEQGQAILRSHGFGSP